MVQIIKPVFSRLNARREKLGISCSVLAKRTGISLRTVQRIVSGEETNPGFLTVAALALELGVGIHFDDELDIRAVRRRQAEKKADRILALVQGNSALEAQAVSRKSLRELREQTVHELLAGSNRKLWAD